MAATEHVYQRPEMINQWAKNLAGLSQTDQDRLYYELGLYLVPAFGACIGNPDTTWGGSRPRLEAEAALFSARRIPVIGGIMLSPCDASRTVAGVVRRDGWFWMTPEYWRAVVPAAEWAMKLSLSSCGKAEVLIDPEPYAGRDSGGCWGGKLPEIPTVPALSGRTVMAQYGRFPWPQAEWPDTMAMYSAAEPFLDWVRRNRVKLHVCHGVTWGVGQMLYDACPDSVMLLESTYKAATDWAAMLSVELNVARYRSIGAQHRFSPGLFWKDLAWREAMRGWCPWWYLGDRPGESAFWSAAGPGMPAGAVAPQRLTWQREHATPFPAILSER